MSPVPSITSLPTEVLHCVFSYLAHGKPSNHLATGKMDQSFRALVFTCHSICPLASDYYYTHKIFKCTASSIVWELIHTNPDPCAVQTFSSCVARIQQLEVEIKFFGTGTIGTSISPSSLGHIDLQIADLESLRSCLERCKLWTRTPFMKKLVLLSTNCAHEQYVVEAGSESPISEQAMYMAVFKPLEKRIGDLYLEHRSCKHRAAEDNITSSMSP